MWVPAHQLEGMLREAGGPLVSTGAQPGPPIPSPPSSIQSHHACGHQGFRQKEACNGRGSLLIMKLPGCCQPGALPHRTDTRQVAVCQARACLGLTGGPVGRQSQLPRKVPLNFPCCLQILPRPLQPRWPRPKHRWPALEPAPCQLCPRTCPGPPDPGV